MLDGKRNLSGDFVVAPVSKKKEEEKYKQQLFSSLQLLGDIYKVIHSIRPMKKLYYCYTSYENLYQVLQLSAVAYSFY